MGAEREQEGHACALAGTTVPNCDAPLPVHGSLKGTEEGGSGAGT